MTSTFDIKQQSLSSSDVSSTFLAKAASQNTSSTNKQNEQQLKQHHYQVQVLQQHSNSTSQAGLTTPNQSTTDQTTPTLGQTLCRWRVWSIMIYVWILCYCYITPLIVMPAIGTHYFGSAGTYLFWVGVFNSVSGFVGFIFQSYIGQLSDMYGRKKVLYFTWCVLVIPYIPFNFSDNIWFYFTLMPVLQLSGSFGGVNGALLATMADVVPSQQRTVMFGILYGTTGLFVVLASVAVVIMEKYFNTRAVIYSFDVMAVVALLWITNVLKETLPLEVQQMNRNHYNLKREDSKRYIRENNIGICQRCFDWIIEPFKALSHIRDNKLIFWISILSFFTQLPECGIQDLMSIYQIYLLEDKYFHDIESKETTFNSIGLAFVGVAMIVSQILLLPLMNKVFKQNDFVLLFVSLCVLLLLCLSGILVYFFQYLWFAYLMRTIFGVSTIVQPIVSSALSKRLHKDQQGLGIGILQAMKGVTYTIAPLLLSFLFKAFKHYGFWVTMPFIASFAFILSSFPILCCPLRNAMAKFGKVKLDSKNLYNKKKQSATPLSMDYENIQENSYVNENYSDSS